MSQCDVLSMVKSLTFLVASFEVLRLEKLSVPVACVECLTYPHKLNKGVIDASAMRKEETTSGAQIVEEEQLLFLKAAQRWATRSTRCKYLSDLSMIPLGSLRQEDLIFCELFLIGKGDAVDTLKGLSIGVAEEV
jgi:hypothetical protein